MQFHEEYIQYDCIFIKLNINKTKPSKFRETYIIWSSYLLKAREADLENSDGCLILNVLHTLLSKAHKIDLLKHTLPIPSAFLENQEHGNFKITPK